MSRAAMSFLSCLLVSNLVIAAEEEATTAAKSQRPAPAASPFEFDPWHLSALGPGALFPSIDAAAIDALIYAYLQAQAACDPELMSGGTIHPVGDGTYSYGEVHRAKPWKPRAISYLLKPQDVARFHLYPAGRDTAVNRINERPSRVDRLSVNVVDPLHRSLYILHPSLTIRVYRGAGADPYDVASLHHPVQPQRFAGRCSPQAPSLGALQNENRVAETREPHPRH